MDSILLIKLIGAPIIFILGATFHFLYKYGGKKSWMTIISPVNESLWEHLKIGYYPFLIYAFVQVLLLSTVPSNFLTAEFIGVYSMLVFIVVVELIYPAVLKRNVLILDFIVFFLAILFGQLVSYFIMGNYAQIIVSEYLILGVILFNAFLFYIFSFKPPKIAIFRDSVDGKYGVK